MDFPPQASGPDEELFARVRVAANAAIQHTPVEPEAPRPVAKLSTTERETVLRSVLEVTRVVAIQRNVPLPSQLIDLAAGFATDSLRAAALRSLASGERETAPEVAAAILKTLDMLSGWKLITALTEAAGFATPLPQDAFVRAEQWLDYRPANDHTSRLLVWPSFEDAVGQYARMRSSGPVKVTLPEHLKTGYFLDRKACRSGKVDQHLLPSLWRLNPFDDRLPAKAFGPRPFGPFITRKLDGAVSTTYWRKGRLHRDSAEGPAQHIQRGDEQWCEYWVDGDLHRDAREGPAQTYTHFEGKEIAGEEYFEEGVWHRPSTEGPAVCQRDRNGRTIREFYIENGVAHRDPADGPAWYAVEDGMIELRYLVRGRLHRKDGPAIIWRDIRTGMIVLEMWYCHGAHGRENGPALTRRDPQTGTVEEEFYGQDGLHRLEGPAVIERDSTGRMIREEFWRHGEPVEKVDPPPANRRARRAARKRSREASRRRS